MLVRLALSELVAIGKLGAQDQRLDQLPDGLLPVELGHVEFELFDVFSDLQIRRLALEYLRIQLNDQLSHRRFIRAIRSFSFGLEGGLPVCQALVDDLVVPIALLAVLLNGLGDKRHLSIFEWHVLRPAEAAIFDVTIELVHVPRVVEQFHGDDAVLDAVVGHSLPVPIPLTLQDDAVELSTIGFAVRRPDGFAVAIHFRFGSGFLDLKGRAFVGCDAQQDGPDIFLVKTAQEAEVFMPPATLRRPGVRDFFPNQPGEESLVLIVIDILEQAIHEGKRSQEFLA